MMRIILSSKFYIEMNIIHVHGVAKILYDFVKCNLIMRKLVFYFMLFFKRLSPYSKMSVKYVKPSLYIWRILVMVTINLHYLLMAFYMENMSMIWFTIESIKIQGMIYVEYTFTSRKVWFTKMLFIWDPMHQTCSVISISLGCTYTYGDPSECVIYDSNISSCKDVILFCFSWVW